MTGPDDMDGKERLAALRGAYGADARRWPAEERAGHAHIGKSRLVRNGIECIEQTDRKRQGKKINQIVTNVLAHISENQLIRVHSVHLPRRKLLPEFL